MTEERTSPYFPDKVLAIVALRQCGHSWRDIGALTDCTGMNAYYAHKRWKEWATEQLNQRNRKLDELTVATVKDQHQ